MLTPFGYAACFSYLVEKTILRCQVGTWFTLQWHLVYAACGEFLWHEPECEELLSESEDYAVACAQCMEEASTAAKQRTVLCFRLCLPSSLDMRILTAVMSFLCVPRGFYKVQNRRYLLQALLMGHVYT